MYQLIDTLEKPYNWLYSFLILLSAGIWAISLTGFSKSFSQQSIVDTDISTLDTQGDWGNAFGFGAVPVAVWFTLLSMLVGLFGITFNQFFLAPLQKAPYWQQSLVLGINFLFSFLISLWLTQKAAKPLSLLFQDYGIAEKAASLVGKVARVSSGKVTSDFGQAIIELNGHNMDIAVRIQEAENEILYGQPVLLLHFDEDKNVYWCEKY